LYTRFVISTLIVFSSALPLHIQASNDTLDLVPVTKQEGFLPGRPFHGHILLAWENDMYFQTDYYFSNGFQIDYFHRNLKRSPLNWILMPARQQNNSNTHYGLQLRQEIFTPKDLAADTISPGDHPYSATLSLSQVKIVNLPIRGIRFSASFRLGVLGPAAMGFRTQSFAHVVSNPSRPPQGWENQLQNDIILNYDFELEKRIAQSDLTMLGIQSRIRLGTLHTDLAAGMWFRLDKRKGYFNRLGPSGEKSLNFIIHFSATANYVFYDATLQGGVFNKTSPYLIPSENIIRWVGNADLSATFELWEHQLEFYAHFLTPQFRDSNSHTWMGIAYKYWF